jgi:hypothetical protein
MATKTLPAAALAVTSLLSVAACASKTVFELPSGGTEAQFHRDNLECAVVAKAVVGQNVVWGPPLFVIAAQASYQNAAQQAHDECMLSRNYVEHKG